MAHPRKVVKSLFSAALKYSGAAWLYERIASWTGRQQVPILLFHRVSDLIPADGLTVTPQRFRAICELLKTSFHVVPLAEIFKWLQNGIPLPERTVAITFDDCYQDNLHAAYILAEFDLPATFFIPTAFVGTDHIFSWDRHLPRMPNLNWADLRTMIRLGHEIGSHTVSHPNMGMLDASTARRELVESKATLEDRLGRLCRLFAYPFGGQQHWRPEWTDLAARAGYLGTVSAYGGFARPDSDARLLPRVPMPYFTCMLNLELHLCGCLDWMYALKRSLGLIPNEQPLPRESRSEETTPEPLRLTQEQVSIDSLP